MSEPTSSKSGSPPIVTAVPDAAPTPSETKKPRLSPPLTAGAGDVEMDGEDHASAPMSSVDPRADGNAQDAGEDTEGNAVDCPSETGATIGSSTTASLASTVTDMDAVEDFSSAAGMAAPSDGVTVPADGVAVPSDGVAGRSTGLSTGGQGGVKEVPSPVVVAEPLPDDQFEVTEEWWDLKMTWRGKVWDVRVGGNDMLFDVRAKIEELTSVPAAAQKIIGLTKGKLSAELDSTRFGALGVKKGCRFTMIGTPQDQVFKDPSLVKLPDIFDDFDMQYPSHPTGKGGGVLPADDPRNKRKVEEVIKSCPITIMNEPRPGKKLLVLDLDYTIVDTKPLLEGSLPAEECARPGLHEFLEAVYEHYDIVVWSQTHWRWLESKLVELGMIGGTRNYRICFVADRTSMFPIFSNRGGKIMKHEVKPLAYFWAKFPEWSAKNTIHIDDLARNFALNPGEGLRIRAFKGAGTLEGLQDRELLRLGPYKLVRLATNDDFTTVNHANWKKEQPPPP